MPTTALLQRADEQIQEHGDPTRETVFVHGDAWPGNMLWNEDTRTTVLIDWNTAGADTQASTSVDYGCR